LKGLTQKAGERLFNTDEQKNMFLKSVGASDDLQELIINNNIIKYVDGLRGCSKLVLTLVGKYFETKLNGV
jgi:hypothetical protein